MQRTCVLVKPDGVCKNLTGKILDRFASAGLQLVGTKMIRLTPDRAEKFYAEHKGKPFFEILSRFMTSAPLVATVWQGEKAIETVRGLMGATDSRLAAPGTLRKEYGDDNRRNVVHGSDSPTSAEREIAFFFRPEELFNYGPEDWDDLKGIQQHGEPKKTSHSSAAR